MVFDFTDFEPRVAEMNKRYQAVSVASDTYLRTKDASDFRRWTDALEKWRAYSGYISQETGFYLFESQSFLEKLRLGDPDTVEDAIRYLERDPYYFRSGYIKEKLLTRLKHLPFSKTQKKRLQRIVLHAISSSSPKVEFRMYLRLIPLIRNPMWDADLAALQVPDTPWNRARKRAAETWNFPTG